VESAAWASVSSSVRHVVADVKSYTMAATLPGTAASTATARRIVPSRVGVRVLALGARG
jgi:homoserine kinase